MGDEEKTRSGRKLAADQQDEAVAGADAGETPQFTTGQQLGAAPPPTTPPGSPPPSLETVQAQTEYVQIAAELAVASRLVGAPPPLENLCGQSQWCLPDVNCRARHFTPEVQAAFNDNHRCVEGIFQ